MRPRRAECARGAGGRLLTCLALRPRPPLESRRLPHSREMTLLCSPKVTQHHLETDTACRHARAVPASGQEIASSFSEARGGRGNIAQDRMARFILSTLRACGADDGTPNRTPSAGMILPLTFARGQNSVPHCVLSVGHSSRAEVGHSCLAPRRGGESDVVRRAGFALVKV
jgi:hypothetical protein